MKRMLKSTVVVAGLCFTLGETVSWGGPPNNDVSDAQGNTASGTGALQNNTSGTNNTASGFEALVSNTTGFANTASGADALFSTTTGSFNTASGFIALFSNTTGNWNTAAGANALYSNTVGENNTASGTFALASNTTGSSNTASGTGALASNTEGWANTASGAEALASNTTGSGNTASGLKTLGSNTTGSGNTALGVFALGTNTTGGDNVASGTAALASNTEGWANTASGAYALYSNTTGSGNTALGAFALGSHTTGSSNLAIGNLAGADLVTGSNNIYLGHKGINFDSNIMRLGETQTRTFIAGIFGSTVGSGSPVVINSQGQLGTLASSARYKRDIHAMGEHSQKMQQLRPVTFRYKEDQEGQLQYGLIAEEVAQVYPELVVRGATGEVESVQYHQLIPLLLNELQHQQQTLEAQGQHLAELKAQNARLQAALVHQHAAVATRLEQLEQGARPLTIVSTR